MYTPCIQHIAEAQLSNFKVWKFESGSLDSFQYTAYTDTDIFLDNSHYQQMDLMAVQQGYYINSTTTNKSYHVHTKVKLKQNKQVMCKSSLNYSQ